MIKKAACLVAILAIIRKIRARNISVVNHHMNSTRIHSSGTYQYTLITIPNPSFVHPQTFNSTSKTLAHVNESHRQTRLAPAVHEAPERGSARQSSPVPSRYLHHPQSSPRPYPYPYPYPAVATQSNQEGRRRHSRVQTDKKATLDHFSCPLLSYSTDSLLCRRESLYRLQACTMNSSA